MWGGRAFQNSEHADPPRGQKFHKNSDHTDPHQTIGFGSLAVFLTLRK